MSAGARLRGGVLVVDKPAGPTSHDVVAVARRAFRGAKVGHTGTLDPMATGVLALVVGRATRLANLLSEGDKVYEAGIRLGVDTDTYDTTGAVLSDRRSLASTLTIEQIDRALGPFVGEGLQTPPPFSAKKLGGIPAYDRARRGETIELAPVSVVLQAIERLGLRDGLLEVRLHCSPGYYVRSLAHDLGAALGTGGCLESLRRVRSGPFDVTGAVTLDTVVVSPQQATEAVIPLESLLPELPPVRLTGEGARRIANGLAVGPAQVSSGLTGRPETRVRLLSPDGWLLGLGRLQGDGTVRPTLYLGMP